MTRPRHITDQIKSRRLRVMTMYLEGQRAPAIARALGVSTTTVEADVQRLRRDGDLSDKRADGSRYDIGVTRPEDLTLAKRVVTISRPSGSVLIHRFYADERAARAEPIEALAGSYRGHIDSDVVFVRDRLKSAWAVAQ